MLESEGRHVDRRGRAVLFQFEALHLVGVDRVGFDPFALDVVVRRVSGYDKFRRFQDPVAADFFSDAGYRDRIVDQYARHFRRIGIHRADGYRVALIGDYQDIVH